MKRVFEGSVRAIHKHEKKAGKGVVNLSNCFYAVLFARYADVLFRFVGVILSVCFAYQQKDSLLVSR